ncbi:MAG: Asp-tRNA(Asn)/Glu-tRNA(Gln) amidotransferase subunit GatA [Pseudomonadota bacterium]|jgi:aspartyl-tRNA(Asn)/glutamyl-tRNA(Gln) amidotransferase subunit A|nr:Asp-tRNA(Asn)/Glu-tRNA(Gln) amidotransferase subunit GatA [Pseudomonadota bacterium]|tara:strand:+ start:716 stop:2194 length:1479 start_codon:yes stop_codon:yes gene_type:complete
MTDFSHLSIHETITCLKRKDFSVSELIDFHVSSMENGRELNAFITETADIAREKAIDSDNRYLKGEENLLDGIPIGIKDMFCTKGIKTTASSKMLENFIPPYESTVTQNLWNDGAILLGKLNNDEFAMGSSNETSFYGEVKNPWKNSKGNFTVPGGSSGGSAASVAAGIGLASLGTDTGGSIRQPASFTGTVGLKPTYGRCSRWGIIAFASSLDQAGPITRNVKDSALILNSICSHDPKDSTSSYKEIPDFVNATDKSIKGMKIGIPKEYEADGISEDISSFIEKGKEWLIESGAEIVDISLPHIKYALPCYYIIAPAEASSNLARYDGVKYTHRADAENIIEMYEETRAQGFGNEVKRRIMIGTYVLSSGYYDAYYLKAQKVRSMISQDFKEAFSKVDAIYGPSTPSTAFMIGDKNKDPLEMYLNDVFTVPVNLAGLPAISVPVGLDKENLPIGMQLIGNSFDEESILSIASCIEKSAKFDLTPEKWWINE